ncbi:MAG: Enoyl-CoA hydratase [Solirubrobacterales bacterium]|jgi:acyl dehydratase|nr:Enoyl-CoA hydratase [Solirubrobacterales bacterium]
MLTIDGIAGLRSRAGEELGVSAWHEITQGEIDDFARLTGDHQWIHVDAARAASSPFGSTIAHGLLTLSLGPLFSQQIYEIVNIDFGLNYGYGRVRFPAPLPVGSRVRMRARLQTVEDVPGGVQITIEQAFERDGLDKPVCVAEILIRVLSDR